MADSSRKKNVIVVDDHSLYREGLVALFEKWDDFDVVYEARNGLEAVAFCRNWPPDIVLMDMRMPVMDGLEATRIICAERPEIAVVLLSIYADEDDVVAAIRAGARGYLAKNLHSRQLHGHLRNVVAGMNVISDEIAGALFEFARKTPRTFAPSEAPDLPRVLTAHEHQLIKLIAMGYSNREIGERLYIGEGTVKKQVSIMLTKLGLENRVQAAVYALRSGLAE